MFRTEAREPTLVILSATLLLHRFHYDSSDYYSAVVQLCLHCSLTTLLWFLRGFKSPVGIALIHTLLFPIVKSLVKLVPFLQNRGSNCEYNYVMLLVSAILLGYFLSSLPTTFPKSFSLGELIIISQALVSFVAPATAYLINEYIQKAHCNLPLTLQVLQSLSIGLLLFSICCIVLTSRSNGNLTAIIWSILIASLSIAYILIQKSVREEPFSWLFSYVSSTETRVQLLQIWGLWFLIAVVFAIVWTKWSSGPVSSTIRKFFHIAIIIVFVTGVHRDIELLSFCSACLLMVFLALEMLRITRTKPFHHLDSCLEHFRDEQDAGLLTVTPMYLLIGSAFPIWILPLGQRPSLATCSGIISIGFGDTAASVIGSWGRNHWPRSKKSLEGSFAAFLAQWSSSVWLWTLLNPSQSLFTTEIIALAIISLVVSVIEAKTKEIDNLTLPLYHSFLMMCAKIYFPRF